MGHQRIGTLPATRKWKAVIALITGGASANEIAAETAIAAEQSLAGCGNSPTSCGEWHVVAVVEPEFASDCAVWLEIGVSVPEHFGSLVATVEVEMGSGRAVPALQPDLDCAKLNLAPLAVELDMTRTEHVDIVRIPAFNLGDSPAAEHLGWARRRHATTANSLGRRTRLQAAAVSMTTQPTRAKPRCRVRRNPAAALIQPNGSSIRLRRRWLTP